mgnify:CR=1 FL=1
MSDENQVKMTKMNYDKDRPKAENPVKVAVSYTHLRAHET